MKPYLKFIFNNTNMRNYYDKNGDFISDYLYFQIIL